MSLLEKYQIKEGGFHPFLIRNGWQLAQLNSNSNQKVENIKKLDVHYNTDEAFILLRGKVVLITAMIYQDNILFEMELMKPKITYNIPKNTWHNIAMEKGSEVLIVEKENTHISDFKFYYLSEEKQKEMTMHVKKLYKTI